MSRRWRRAKRVAVFKNTLRVFLTSHEDPAILKVEIRMNPDLLRDADPHHVATIIAEDASHAIRKAIISKAKESNAS